MTQVPWFERSLKFGYAPDLLPYFLIRLEGTRVRIQHHIQGMEDSVLSYKENGKWSIKENIGHLAEVDAIANKRLDEMVAGVTVMSPAVFEPQNYNPWSIDTVLALFEKNRSINLEKYQHLSPSDLTKASIHPRLKVPMTPVDLAWFDAEHDDHHLVKIVEIIRSIKS